MTTRMFGRLSVALVALLALGAFAAGPGVGNGHAAGRSHHRLRHGQKVDERRRVTRGAKVLRELAWLRTRTSRTYATPHQGRVTRIWTHAVNFRNQRGRWQLIDSRLRPVPGAFVNTANSYTVRLPARLRGSWVQVTDGRWWVAFRPRGGRGVARIAGAQASYSGAFPGVDLSYQALGDSVKEALVLHSLVAGDRAFAFDLKLAAGLRPVLLRSHALALRDAQGRTRLSIAAPFLIDAKGVRATQVAVRLVRVHGAWRLTVRPNSGWLRAPQRAFPVTVDPYVTLSKAPDCYLDSSNPESSVCGASTLQVGSQQVNASTTATYNAVLRFDASAIPTDAAVGYANMYLYETAQATTNTMTVDAYPLTQAWTGAASWNRFDGQTWWNDPGGEIDGATPANAQAQLGGTSPTFGWKRWMIDDIVQQWVNDGRPNHGLQLHAESSSNLLTFDSAEYNAGSNAPYIDVGYFLRTGDAPAQHFEQQKLSDRIDLKVNASNGNLVIDQHDFRMPGGLGPDVDVSRTYNSSEGSGGAYAFRGSQGVGG